MPQGRAEYDSTLPPPQVPSFYAAFMDLICNLISSGSVEGAGTTVSLDLSTAYLHHSIFTQIHMRCALSHVSITFFDSAFSGMHYY